MSVAQYFSDFMVAITIPADKRGTISYRTARITKQLNSDYRGSTSETANRFYGGSYGRNTAIPSVSDVDLMYVLPYPVYERFNAYAAGGQSALLQEVKRSVERTYPNSAVIADGQIIGVAFVDGITFEIVPVFLNKDGSYTYACSNDGGTWKVCKPKHEIDEFAARDSLCNRNLVDVSRMARAWRDFNNVPMSGMLIDTLAYQFIANWQYRDKSYLYFDFLTRDFFNFLANQSTTQNYWLAPGSGSYVWRTGSFEYKARQAELRALEALRYIAADEHWSARQKYREIYGPVFPS